MELKADITQSGSNLSLIAMNVEEGTGYELIYSLLSREFTEAFTIEVQKGRVLFCPCSIDTIPLNLTIQSQKLIRENYR